jgi:tetratricopeptide (TPR) repeat protein
MIKAALNPTPSAPGQFATRLPQRLWIGLATVTLAGSFMAGKTCSEELEVGEKVMVVSNDAEFKAGDKVTGHPGLGECLKIGNPGPGVLTKIKGDWLWVSEQRAYVHRRHVVPAADAVDRCTASIQRSPTSQNFVLRGIARQRDGDPQALDDFNRAIELNAKNADAYYQRASARWSDAFFGKSFGQPVDARVLKSVLADLGEAVRLNPHHKQAFVQRTRVWWSQQKYDEAAADFEQAIKIDANDGSVVAQRGRMWLEAGQYDRAIADFSAAMDMPPYGRISGYLYNRGQAWASKIEYEKAAADYSECLRTDHDFPSALTARYDRAVAYQHLGHFRKAIQDLLKCAQAKEAWDEHHSRLAWLLATCPDAELRDGPSAVKHAEHACETSRWKNADFIDTLAAAQAETGAFELAIETEQRALELATDAERPRFEHRLDLYQAGKPYRIDKEIEKKD